MMIRFLTALVNILFPCLVLGAASVEAPPKTYVNKAACPYECCTYREWEVKKDTDLYDAIDGKKMNVQAKAGTKITAVTGEVHSQPLKITDRDGKEIYLLTYEGEGYWTTWQNGQVVPGVEQNWSTEKTPYSVWWVQMKIPNSDVVGWTKETNNFVDNIGCGTESDAKVQSDSKGQSEGTEIPAVSSAAAANTLTCNLSVTGIENKAQFVKFFSEFKLAVVSQNKKAVSQFILFPLKVNGDAKKYTIKDSAEFKKKYATVFTKKITDAIASQDIGNLFCRDQGVMIGSGQVWITQKKGRIGVYVINQ